MASCNTRTNAWSPIWYNLDCSKLNFTSSNDSLIIEQADSDCCSWDFILNGGGGSVLSVGLTMPSAFSVAGSPVTGSGVLAVTATGTDLQYIKGDGTLGTFAGDTFYGVDGTLNSPRTVDGDGFSLTFTDLSLFRIVNGDSTIGGTYDFTTGVDFLAFNATNSSNLTLDPLAGLKFQYTTLAGPTVNSSLEVTPTGVKFTGIQEFADNAAAITGGLTVGYLYRTGDALKIVH